MISIIKKGLNKKGMTASFLVGLIITIVSFMIIANVIFQFLGSAEDKEAELLCHDSLALRASTTIQLNQGKDQDWHDLLSGNVKMSPVLCKTIDIKLKGTREEIKRAFAEKIARCWWMFGEGRYEEILDTGDLNVAPFFLGVHNEPNQCFNCYNIMIDQDEIVGDDEVKCATEDCPISPQELLRFMWDKSPLKARVECNNKTDKNCVFCNIDKECNSNGGDLKCIDHICEKDIDINYLQYIQSYGGPGMFINIIEEEGLQARHAYSISILPKNKEKEQTNWLAWVGGGVAVLGIGACIIISGGACAAAVIPFMSVTAAGGTAVAAGAATVGVVGAKVAAGAIAYDYITAPDAKSPPQLGATLNSAAKISIETMFKERERTSVYLSETKYGQTYCGSGDLGGE
ncbi:hypothetical protein COY27_03680 [Candidatus Woesearchaeota archaeon CG_4_10_14_0_2_um_filter_33_13]|nr:MAG: hypothetical protein COY27_03680 [Candidatus Woesearchaeota archaeon CG_4_10_14_0_2_um_filter_33_13]